MDKPHVNDILYFLKEQRGLDFSGYRTAMLERRIQKRVFATNSVDIEGYCGFLKRYPEELDHLLDVLTINVSCFFRNSLAFEFITKIVIPDAINNCAKSENKGLRIWSAGCSFGEEAYSMAILLKEILKKEECCLSHKIFATDIDKKALEKAIVGVYNFQSIKDVKYELLTKYFKPFDDSFILDPSIKETVQFSIFDLLSKKQSVPPDSIFGGFDIVLCRNVLIYYNLEHQKTIFTKLYKSLNKNGVLVLGEAELPISEYKDKFTRINSCCKIYRKVG